MSTPDNEVAERIGAFVDGRITALQDERRTLSPAAVAARVAAIDAELALLQTEKTRLDPRRPPRTPVITGASVADAPPTRIR